MYDKIKEFFPRDIDFIVFAVLVLLAFFGICIGAGALLLDRSGTSTAGAQLEQAEHHQQHITEQAKDGREQAANIATGMQEAGAEIGATRRELQDSRNLIEDSQRILEAVRRRGESQAKKN